MTRLFATLYFLLVLALVEYWVITIFVPGYFLDPIKLEYSYDNYKGTLFLLKKEIEGLEDTERTERVKSIQSKFEYPIDLVAEDSVDLSEDDIELLDKGKLAEREIDGADQGIFRSSVPGYVWVFDSDQTESEHNRRISIGTFRLVEDQLAAVHESEWQSVIDGLNQNFGFPVSLLPLDDANLNSEQKSKIGNGKTIGLDINTDDEQYYYPLENPIFSNAPNSPLVLRFGPIDFPIFIPWLVVGLIVILGILIAIAVWVWIKPIWSNLTSLRNAAEKFGTGDFSARVNFSKRSGIREVSTAFNDMATRIQNLLSSHKELTNAVSHELRTPLSRLRFSMEMLQGSDGEVDRKRHIKNMAEDINELDTLTNELLTYARFDRDASGIRTEKLHLPSWLKAEVERLTHYHEEHPTITLQIHSNSETCLILAEARLLSRAISNLVQNSLRYAQSTVDISMVAHGKYCLITLDDDGPGIPVSQRESVFDPFTRLDHSRNRQSGGFGLGLSIVKQIIDWHRGTISIEQAPIGGARFSISLPAHVPGEQPDSRREKNCSVRLHPITLF